ncbi:hypothetical protein JOY44_23315 [Phormidium sp. CLA17]|uniref:hypothetical protein n=1 Tax=Leptolyngbya sp. Cla-17 TaxID=2803751 RepID=UPI0019313A75|nr:hypothetical protein [Leptolyngbya sp. Cla-17]MBM0744501.1 hypothetical protein [Leptolyngbya sp. Cla-17]
MAADGRKQSMWILKLHAAAALHRCIVAPHRIEAVGQTGYNDIYERAMVVNT